MSIGDNIKRIAEKQGLTMYRIAKEGQVSQSYICEIVSNKRNNPSVGVLKKIAEVLKVTIDELVG